MAILLVTRMTSMIARILSRSPHTLVGPFKASEKMFVNRVLLSPIRGKYKKHPKGLPSLIAIAPRGSPTAPLGAYATGAGSRIVGG